MSGLLQADVGFEGLESLIRKIKTMPDAIKAEADAVILDVAENMAGAIAARYPSRRLKRGVTVRKLGPMMYRVRSGASLAPIFEFSKEQIRRHKTGKSTGVMTRIGPIFSVEKIRWHATYLRRLREVLRDAGRGAGSAGGAGLL